MSKYLIVFKSSQCFEYKAEFASIWTKIQSNILNLEGALKWTYLKLIVIIFRHTFKPRKLCVNLSLASSISVFMVYFIISGGELKYIIVKWGNVTALLDYTPISLCWFTFGKLWLSFYHLLNFFYKIQISVCLCTLDNSAFLISEHCRKMKLNNKNVIVYTY